MYMYIHKNIHININKAKLSYTKVAEDQQTKVGVPSLSLAVCECVHESIRVHDMYR